MLKTQENDTVQLISRIGLSIRDFEWTSELYKGTTPARRLTHQPTGFYYQFRTAGGNQLATVFPNENGAVIDRSPGSWLLQLEYFWQWLQLVRKEVDAPDLWANAIAAAQGSLLLPAANEPMGASERQSVGELIAELRQYITQRADATDKRLVAIAEQLAYLEEASQRLGRKDWINAAIGVTLSILASGIVSPEEARTAIQMTLHGLQGIFSGAVPLPRLPR